MRLIEMFDPSDHPKNVQQVNAFLHANGVPKGIKLRRGQGYYFVGGYTFQQWLDEYNQLKADAIEAGQSETESVALKEQGDAEHWKTLAQTGFWGKQGAGAIFLARDTGRLLIAHRSRSVEQPGTWGTWGGAIDDSEGETPLQAVRREVKEESGYHGQFDIYPLFVFQKGTFKYHNFLVLVDHEFTPKLDWENQGYKWVVYGDWPKPMHFGLDALIKNSGDEIERQTKAVTESTLQEARTRTLYHVAPVKKLSRIKKQGIQPQKKPSTTNYFGADVRKQKEAIYAFEHPEDAVRWAWRMSWQGDNDVVIIQFRSKASWLQDQHFEAGTGKGKWLVSMQPVPPEDFIKIVPFNHLEVRAEGFDLDYTEEPIKGWLAKAARRT